MGSKPSEGNTEHKDKGVKKKNDKIETSMEESAEEADA